MTINLEQLGHKSVYFGHTKVFETEDENVATLYMLEMLEAGWCVKMQTEVERVNGTISYTIYCGA